MRIPEKYRDRRRSFELPNYRELTKEQERIRRLPPDGSHVITGGPGTGKSVVALIRARDQKERFPFYQLLVFNVLLNRFCRQLLPEVRSTRFHAWFWNRFQELYRQRPPEESRFHYDWKAVKEIYYSLDSLPLVKEEMLIIDEGQDLPQEFYDFLSDHDLRVFVVADENQQLFEVNSNVDQIEEALGLARGSRHVLTRNWRNSFPIARLAQEFYHNPQIPRPELPEEDEEALLPYILEYHAFARILDFIVNLAKTFKKDLIGIITPDETLRKKYVHALNREMNRRGLAIPVTTYFNEMKEIDVRFDLGSIVVVNRQSCKGLEFDNVFIGNLNHFPVIPDKDQHLKDFYVMITRARKRLYFFRDMKDDHCPMAEFLYRHEHTLLNVWRQSHDQESF